MGEGEWLMGAWGLNDALDVAGGYYRLLPLPRLAGLGVLAVKKELQYNGFGSAIDLSNNRFGMATYRATKRFQEIEGIGVDGVIGQTTARHLFRKRASGLEARWSVPDGLLQRLKTLESANDPSAYGYTDADDHGLVQINLRIHTNVTLEEALDPFYALQYAANAVTGAFAKFNDWDVAVASWNVGVGGATSWLSAGKPSTGGTAGLPDLYSRATQYIALVRSQPL